MSVEFFQTRMGRQFYEGTMPALVKQLERIADGLPTGDAGRAAQGDDLLLAVYGLINAVDQVRDTEIMPGSEETKRAFTNLRERVEAARQAADAIH